MRLQANLMYRSSNLGSLGFSLRETEAMPIDEALEWARMVSKLRSEEAEALRKK